MEGINVCCMTMLPDFYATLRQRRNRAIDVVSVPRRCPADFGRDGVDSAPFPRRGGGPFAYGTVSRTNVANSFLGDEIDVCQGVVKTQS